MVGTTRNRSLWRFKYSYVMDKWLHLGPHMCTTTKPPPSMYLIYFIMCLFANRDSQGDDCCLANGCTDRSMTPFASELVVSKIWLSDCMSHKWWEETPKQMSTYVKKSKIIFVVYDPWLVVKVVFFFVVWLSDVTFFQNHSGQFLYKYV